MKKEFKISTITKTPLHTPDWYIKWVASCFLMVGMSVRGIEGYQMYDLVLSTCGVSLWLWVSILWKSAKCGSLSH